MDNVRCNYCEAVFADNEIILTTDEREKCPTCGEIGFIMDLEREITMEMEMCVACHNVPTEDSLCDDCFAELPMDTWVTVTEKGK